MQGLKGNEVKMKVVMALVAVYLMAIVLDVGILPDILTVLVMAGVSHILYECRKSMHRGRRIWGFIVAAAVTWTLADLLWLMYTLFAMDPEESTLITYLYIVPNLFIVIGSSDLFLRNLKRWNKFQLSLDALAVIVLSMVFFFNVFGDAFEQADFTVVDTINTTVTFVTDVAILTLIAIAFISVRSSKILPAMRLLSIGCIIYAVTDLSYVYGVFTDTYVPNGLVDFNYILAFFIFVLSANFQVKSGSDYHWSVIGASPGNMGRSRKSLLFFAVPIILYALNIVGVFEALLIVVGQLVYELVSSYIQMGMKNEYLYKKEQHMKEELALQVEERTRELLRVNEELETLTKKDTLTGLFNRRHFINELEKRIERGEGQFAILYMDLDRFKIVNDTHGHSLGDEVLISIAERFIVWKTEGMIVSRIGGDEFVILLEKFSGNNELEDLCKQIHELMKEPIRVEPYMFSLDISIGIARYPHDSVDRDELLKFADLAMYHAKEKYYGDKCSLYTNILSEKTMRSHQLEVWLRNVEFDESFELHYQPQMSIGDGALVGMEALLRWTGPDGKLVSPAEFIPIAEETGLIIPISEWVNRTAFKRIADWNGRYGRQLVMGVNISPKLIDSADFVLKIERKIMEMGIDPAWLDLEITESSAMNRGVAMEEVLTALSSVGVRISIDDFGTGYSSMSYLKRYDVDRLKIAKELIDSIGTDRNDYLIVKAIIMMASAMGIKTIAEGVESDLQVEILKELGCDEIQGYVFGRPVDAESFERTYLQI